MFKLSPIYSALKSSSSQNLRHTLKTDRTGVPNLVLQILLVVGIDKRGFEETHADEFRTHYAINVLNRFIEHRFSPRLQFKQMIKMTSLKHQRPTLELFHGHHHSLCLQKNMPCLA